MVQTETPPRPRISDPSVVRVSIPVRVEWDIEEGPPVLFRAEGPVAQVVVVRDQERAPGVDDWYVMFNDAESMDVPRIASR
jgi:hypothetical protein